MSASYTYHETSEARYLKIRVAFLGRGSSLHRWCQENNIPMSNARAALLGAWNGPKAVALVERIILASEGQNP